MQLRDKIHEAINSMPKRSLIALYEQIKILENINYDLEEKKTNVSGLTLEEVLQATAESKTSWADSVVQDREDRV